MSNKITQGSLVQIRIQAVSGSLRTAPVTSSIRYRVTAVEGDRITIAYSTQTGLRKSRVISAKSVVHVYN